MHRTLRFALLGWAVLALTSCDVDRPVSFEADNAGALAFDQTGPTLRLVSICEGIWRVDNLMEEQADFTWDHVGSGITGSGSVEGSARVYFRGPHLVGTPNTSRLFYGGVQVNVKASNNGPCRFALSGSVYNDVNENGVRDQEETGLGGLTMRLSDAGQGVLSSFVTSPAGAYVFDAPQLVYGLEYTIAIPASTPEADNNEVIIPYFAPTSPSALPHAITFEYPTGLKNVGDVSSTFGSETLDFGLVLQPLELAAAFEGNALTRDGLDDHFWWDQMRRSLTGAGAQNNAVVKTQQLTQLLQIIQFGSAEIDPFYAVPFRFEGNPIAAAEAILKPPSNRNSQKASFESALLTVWLNRVYGSQINTVLLDGLLLAAEQAYIQQNNIVQPMGLFDSAAPMTTTNSVSSLDDFTRTLNSTYRSGSGGIGSN
jgi:hypothetical protein